MQIVLVADCVKKVSGTGNSNEGRKTGLGEGKMCDVPGLPAPMPEIFYTVWK